MSDTGMYFIAGLRNCDAKGPLMMCISKIISTSAKGCLWVSLLWYHFYLTESSNHRTRLNTWQERRSLPKIHSKVDGNRVFLLKSNTRKSKYLHLVFGILTKWKYCFFVRVFSSCLIKSVIQRDYRQIIDNFALCEKAYHFGNARDKTSIQQQLLIL